jgi:hypothetical protein
MEDTFDACWKCGTSQDGVPAEHFEPESDDPTVPDLGPDAEPLDVGPDQAEFPPIDDLVTIATYDLPAKADIERQVLEEEGIQTFLADDNIVAMNWFLANAVGGAKLKVAASNAPRAIEILESYRKEDAGPVNDEPAAEITFACEFCGCEITVPGERRGLVEVCPLCGEYVDVPE